MKSCESARFFNTSLPGKVPTVAVLRFSAEPQPFAHSPQLFAHSGARGLLRRNYWNSAGRAPSPGLSLPWKLKRVGTTTVVVVRCTSDFLRMPKEPNPICIFLLFPPTGVNHRILRLSCGYRRSIRVLLDLHNRMRFREVRGSSCILSRWETLGSARNWCSEFVVLGIGHYKL